MLKISHGSGFVMLQFPSHLNVADKKWHRLEVRTNGQVSYLIPPPPPHPPIRIIYISNSISLCRNRRVEKTDWVIICIILTVLVDLMNNTNFGKTALSVLNLPMLQSIFWDQRNFFSCFLSSAAHVECA